MREPLLHFLGAGLLLFAGYRGLHREAELPASSRRIELTDDDLRQMESIWAAQWRRPPKPDEQRRLVENRVREEILYREALALGLDQGDSVVRRRLVQKLEFLTEDLSTLRDPASGELRAWFDAHADRFAMAGRISFYHLYFSFDHHGAGARAAAERALGRIAGQPSTSVVARSLADPFMFQDSYRNRSAAELAGIFGASFAETLFRLRPGAWQGPIESGYGWHVVWVDGVTPTRVPAFEEVEADVKAEWMAEQRDEAKRKAFEMMRSRYEVSVPESVRAEPQS